MAKARVTYGFGGPIVDANRNEAVTDYITRGQSILTTANKVDTLGGWIFNTHWHFSPWPFNPYTSIWNRMRFSGVLRGANANISYTLDTGINWTNIVAVGAPPLGVATRPPAESAGVILFWDSIIPIDGITTFEWIGWRMEPLAPGMPDATSWSFCCFLYENTEDPY